MPQLTQGISVELNLLEISQEVAPPNTRFTTALGAPLPARFHLPEPKTLAPPQSRFIGQIHVTDMVVDMYTRHVHVHKTPACLSATIPYICLNPDGQTHDMTHACIPHAPALPQLLLCNASVPLSHVSASEADSLGSRHLGGPPSLQCKQNQPHPDFLWEMRHRKGTPLCPTPLRSQVLFCSNLLKDPNAEAEPVLWMIEEKKPEKTGMKWGQWVQGGEGATTVQTKGAPTGKSG